MTAVAVRSADAPVALATQPPAIDFGALMEFARELVPTGFLPDHIKNAGQCCAIILAGRELGMEPMLALRSISMVKGKIVVAADAQLALFKSKGGRAQFDRLDDTIAVLQLIHPNGDQHTESFSIEDARRAGLLNNSNWKNFPKAMLRSRCITAGLKSVGFEPTSGTYDPDEAQHFNGVPSMGANTTETASEPAPSRAAANGVRELTVAEAKLVVLPGGPKAFGGNGGKLLDSFSSGHLQSMQRWFEEKLEEGHRDDFAECREAIVLILEDREKDQTKMDFDAGASVSEAMEPISAAQAESDQVLGVKPSEKPKPRGPSPIDHGDVNDIPF